MGDLEVSVPTGAGRQEIWHRRALLLLPLLVAIPVGVIIVSTRFDGLYGQDAYAYYRYAVGPLRENILALRPPPPFFWPPGYPLLVALVSLLLGTEPVAGQAVSLVSGALVPLLVALLAWELWRGERNESGDSKAGMGIALLAGLFTAFMGQLWLSSAVVMSDATSLAAATLGVWALARYGRPAGGQWLLLAASALAFAVLTRWAYALVALPATACALMLLARRPRQQAALHALAAALAVLAILSPIALSTLQESTTPGGDEAAFVGDLEVYSWNPLNALRNEFVNIDGHLRYRLPNGLYYALAPAHGYYFTPLLAPLLLFGVWGLWRERTSLRLLLLVGWAGIVYVFLAGAPWQNFRFALSYLPPLAILASVGTVSVHRLLAVRLRPLLWLLLAAGFLWMGYGGWTMTESFITRKQANLATVHWVEEQVEPDARLFTFAVTLAFEQYTHLDVHELFLLAPQGMEALLEDARPTYLLLDPGNIETQWIGRAPYRNYQWLQQEASLLRLGQHRNFVLYRIQPSVSETLP